MRFRAGLAVTMGAALLSGGCNHGIHDAFPKVDTVTFDAKGPGGRIVSWRIDRDGEVIRTAYAAGAPEGVTTRFNVGGDNYLVIHRLVDSAADRREPIGYRQGLTHTPEIPCDSKVPGQGHMVVSWTNGRHGDSLTRLDNGCRAYRVAIMQADLRAADTLIRQWAEASAPAAGR